MINKEDISVIFWLIIGLLGLTFFTILVHELGHFVMDTLSTGKIRGYFVILPTAFGYKLRNQFSNNMFNLLGGLTFNFIEFLGFFYIFLKIGGPKSLNDIDELIVQEGMALSFLIIFISIILSPFDPTSDLYKIAIIQQADPFMVSMMFGIVLVALFSLFLLIVYPGENHD